MESCRRIDDLRRHPDLQGPVSSPGWNVGPPPLPAAAHGGGEEGELFPVHTEHVVIDMVLGDSQRPIVAQGSRRAAEDTNMANAKESLTKLDNLDGFIGAALVDSESGMLLAQEGGGPLLNIEIAGAVNTDVVRAKRKAMKSLGLKDEIEDILISLTRQYHLIRPLRSKPALFFYVALDRQRANLAMARLTLAEVERDLQT